MRLLFSSIHCYLDPSSGAALCTRELLELLAARGADCRVLTRGILDPERETSLHEVLATLGLPAGRFQARLGRGGVAEVVELGVNGVRVTVMPTASSRAERSPDPRESAIFLELAEQVLERFRPDVLLTYGGHPASLELMRRARRVAGAVCPCHYQHCHRIYGHTPIIASAPLIMVCSLSQPRQIVIHPGSPSLRRPKNPPSLANSRKKRPTVNAVEAPSFRTAFSALTYLRGSTSAAGRSGAVRASPFNWYNRTAATDINPIMASSRALVSSSRCSTRRPVFITLCHSSICHLFS